MVASLTRVFSSLEPLPQGRAIDAYALEAKADRSKVDVVVAALEPLLHRTVNRIARQFNLVHRSDDLFGDAVMIVCTYVGHYDGRFGASAYLVRCVDLALRRSAKQMLSTVHVPVHAVGQKENREAVLRAMRCVHNAEMLAEVPARSEGRDEREDDEHRRLHAKRLVAALLGRLGVSERKVLRMTFGIGDKVRPLLEIAQRLGISRQRVCQIRDTALHRLME